MTLHHFRGFAILMFFIFAGCGEAAETAVPRLTKQLEAKESSERNGAALKLASYGEKAQSAVPALIRRLGDGNAGVRSSAAYALRAIGTPEAEAALDHYKK